MNHTWHWALTLSVLVLLQSGVTAPTPLTAAEPMTTVKCKPLQTSRLSPSEVIEIAPGHYFLDFAKAWFAGLELEIAQPEPGRVIVVHMGEAISAPRTVHRKPGGSVRYHTETITLEQGKGRYTVPLGKDDHRLMPKAIGPVMPYRYVELENAPKNVRAWQVAASYEFNPEAARFASSDPKLNAIWDFCKHTIRATSFAGLFVDGDRERKPYEADAYINQLGWYYCTDDLTLPRYSHEYLIRKPTWPTEWILFSVLMAWEDYRFTGDLTSVRAFYDDLKGKTLIALAREDGLISTVEPPFPKAVGKSIHIGKIRDIVDWPPFETDGYQFKPVNTIVNAFHVRALEAMASLAGAVGNLEDGKAFKAAAAKALASFNQKLTDPVTGLYLDGEGSTHSSLHANMFPLAFGLVPQERRATVAQFVKSRGMACSVYGAQFLLEVLFDNGMADHALSLMTADNDRSWSHMIERLGATMALEAWDRKYKPNLDWNHAWGAAPANILPRKVLGVEPLVPGYSRIAIRPQLGHLTRAEGTVPTLRGPVTVSIDRTAAEFRMTVEIPANTTARVSLPRGGRLLLDGKEVKGIECGNDLVVDPVGAGRHEIVAGE